MTTPTPQPQPTGIFIQATETDPYVAAAAAVRAGQRQLLDDLRAKLVALTATHLNHEALEAARTALIESCDAGVRRHLDAADQALYAPASGAAETRLLIRALRNSASALTSRIDTLAAANEAADAAGVACGIEALLSTHFAIEQEVLLPALGALPGVDLPSVVEDWHTVLDGGSLAQPDVIDATELPHGRRHPRIFARYARLAPGEAFTLVNNHDPKPLRREFEATHPGAFTWDYLESGPERWAVRIGRVAEHAG